MMGSRFTASTGVQTAKWLGLACRLVFSASPSHSLSQAALRAGFDGSMRPYQVTPLGKRLSVTDAGGVENGATEEDPRLRQMRVEAVLLLAKSPISVRKLSQLAHLADATEARTLVRQLNRTYDDLGRAIRVEHVAGGYRMLTRPALSPWLTRLGHLPAPVRLSTPMMETLAVVAYRQPVSRASAEAVRGVACGELLRQLMERELVRIVGRSEELGRPYLYGTTKRFLQLFGLPNADALPTIQWQALQEDPSTEDSTPDDLSTSTKDPVVSTSVAPVLAETTAEPSGAVVALAPSSDTSLDPHAPSAAIEDEEDELYDDDDEDSDDDWDDADDDDWDDDDLDGDDDDDDADEDDDDDESDDWVEVDDEDADSDDDDDSDVEDDEDWDDDDTDDDEDWVDDDEEESDDDSDVEDDDVEDDDGEDWD